jgi:hypothetical protein
LHRGIFSSGRLSLPVELFGFIVILCSVTRQFGRWLVSSSVLAPQLPQISPLSQFVIPSEIDVSAIEILQRVKL